MSKLFGIVVVTFEHKWRRRKKIVEKPSLMTIELSLVVKKLIVYANIDSPMDFSTINTKVLKNWIFILNWSPKQSVKKKNQLSKSSQN